MVETALTPALAVEVVLAVVKARGTIKPTITVAVLALSQETKISTSETSIPKIHALFIDNMITFGENASLTQRMPATMVAVEAEEVMKATITKEVLATHEAHAIDGGGHGGGDAGSPPMPQVILMDWRSMQSTTTRKKKSLYFLQPTWLGHGRMQSPITLSSLTPPRPPSKQLWTACMLGRSVLEPRLMSWEKTMIALRITLMLRLKVCHLLKNSLETLISHGNRKLLVLQTPLYLLPTIAMHWRRSQF